MVAAGTPVISMRPEGALKVKFYLPETVRRRVRASASRSPSAATAAPMTYRHAQFLRLGAAVHPAGDLLARRAQPADLPRRSDARRGRPAARPARHGGATENERAARHRRQWPDQEFRAQARGRSFRHPGAQGRDLRLSRAERLGQDHDHPHALRPADADEGEGTCLGFDVRPRADRIKAGGRLHDAEVLVLRGSCRSARTSISSRRVYRLDRPQASASAGTLAGSRADLPSRAARRHRCPAAGSSAWRWPPASCTSPSCCCSTSPPRASTPRRGASSGTRSVGSPPSGVTVLVSTHYMDEAVRCHRITYIAYGKELVDGPSARWSKMVGARRPGGVEGPDLAVAQRYQGHLKKPGVGQVSARSARCCMSSGTDKAELDATRRQASGQGHADRCQPAG